MPVDALETERKSRALTIWLRKFPAAGKNRHAHDFTDALFAGYNRLTCAVWAGFDKPQNLSRRVQSRAGVADLGRR
jgi:membrane carboxypeptidase/penicillin-binding protein